MKSALKIAFCSSVLGVSTAFTSHAADLTSVEGSLVLERAGEFSSVVQNDKLLAGDKIYAVNGATANIALASDCSVTVETNQIVTLLAAESSECASLYSVTNLNAEQLAALGSSNLQGESNVVALIAFAAATGFIVLLDDNDEPASP